MLQIHDQLLAFLLRNYPSNTDAWAGRQNSHLALINVVVHLRQEIHSSLFYILLTITRNMGKRRQKTKQKYQSVTSDCGRQEDIGRTEPDNVMEGNQFPHYGSFERRLHWSLFGFPSQRASDAGFYVWFDVCQSKRLNKQIQGQWFGTLMITSLYWTSWREDSRN